MTSRKSGLLLAAIILLSQAPNAHARQSDTSFDDSSSIEVSNSVDKERQDTKRQIDENKSAPPIPSILPASGLVMTPQQQRAATKGASAITPLTNGNKISSKTASGRPTVAIALGGGGARGAAHVGVLRVLKEEGIPIDEVVGNSMGSIVGGLYSAGVSLDDIAKDLEDLSLRKAYMPGGIAKQIAILPFDRLLHPLGPKHYAGLWSGKTLTKYLDNALPRPNMEIGDTQIPFSPIATNLLDGKAYRLTKGRLSTAIKASSAISPIIQPVAMGDKLFIDGGVRANLPAEAARGTGAGFVIAVLVDEPMQQVPSDRFRKVKYVAARMSDIVLAIADERQLQFADLVINPNVSDIPILSKNPKDVRKAELAGEMAARKAIPELRKRLGLASTTAALTAEPIAQ